MRAWAGLFALFISFLLVAPAGATPEWIVENGSQISFTASQGGAPVEGVFERFEATITFAENDLQNSAVTVEIDIGSVNSQSKDRDDTIKSSGLFDVAKWPTAIFKAAAFRHLGAEQFEADGTLTMRDVSMPVTLPFTLEIGAHPNDQGRRQARAKGKLTVQRLDYGIGQGVWKDTSIVGNTVTILIDLVAKQ